MTDLELIGKQQLEISNLKEKLTRSQEALRYIRLQIIRVGGPLNDNCGQYSREQLVPFQRILTLAEDAKEDSHD